MQNAFGLWTLVIVSVLLAIGSTCVKHGSTARVWAGVVLIVLACAMFGSMWMFVSGRW